MSIIITKRLFTCTSRNLSKIKVDVDGLLAQLRPPPKDSISREDLKSNLNELTKFVEAIQLEDFGTTKPLSHIWQEGTGLELRIR
ncbi:unnamed protein product [Cunninghamella echinulata]